jgi:hypothetical protein
VEITGALEIEVLPEGVEHRWKVTPYRGRRLEGKVELTILLGSMACERGRHFGPARGTVLVRPGYSLRSATIGSTRVARRAGK